MPGTLYVVATPIGNLEDVTLRALRVLREVAVIAAEDTRRTARLLQHYSISTPTTSLHEHNEHAKSVGLVERLRAGDSIALVSDAGTPGISDPGTRFIAAAHEAGCTVEPVPGPNAAIAVLSASGIPVEDGFLFLGFPPAKSGRRRRWLQELAPETRTLILYEAPHRIHETLHDMASELGNRQICLGREVTKTHESLAVRPIQWWLEHLPPAKGEFVLIVASRDTVASGEIAPASDHAIAETFGLITESGQVNRREALKATAKQHGVSARQVFAALERTKLSGN
jgi:16S rRNA (cytidine1402-2'-O)-methyltransferase